MSSTTASFVISSYAVFVVNFDDPCMQGEVGVRVERVTKTRSRVTGPIENLSVVLDDLRSRGGGGGWDQPPNWPPIARRAYESAVKQLQASGYAIDFQPICPGVSRAIIVECR